MREQSEHGLSANKSQALRPPVALVVGILVLASSVSIMSTDMYTPSLPDIANWFDTTPTMVKLTISLNMLAFGLAQLIHGPLSDRFGRKPVLIVSSVFVVVFSLGCALAQSIEQLIVVRVLLGLTAAAEAVIGLAIIKDLYSEKQQVKAMALLGMAIAITPAAAPIIGGYLHVAFGWQSNFYVISGMAVISTIVITKVLPESTTPDPRALEPRRLSTAYASLLKNSDFLTHCAILGVALGVVFVFVTGGPFVLIDQLGVPAKHFGYYQASFVVAFFFGSALASRLADSWKAMSLLRVGVGLVLLGSMALCVIIFNQWTTPITLLAAYMIITFGMGPLFAVTPSRALRSIEGQAGTASALLSAIEQTMAGMAALCISLLNDGTARPMGLITLVLGVMLYLLFKRSKMEDVRRISG